MKRFILFSLLLFAFTLAAQTPAPIMLDEIHYYINDRAATNAFFKQYFGAKAMMEETSNPFQFIDFLNIRPGQSTINISARGPFPGIAVGDPKRWEREVIAPSPTLPPQYGVHWVAFEVKNLKKTMKRMAANGVVWGDKAFAMPGQPDVKAAWCWGPDYNCIVLVENKKATTDFGIHHLRLLVKSLPDNLRFWQEVFAATVVGRTAHSAVLLAGGHQLILSEPEDLGLDRSAVSDRNPKQFRAGVDHIGFLYPSVHVPYEAALAKGYKFLSKPIEIMYYGKPTLYTFAIIFSPDGLQVEMAEEKGRLGPRTKVK
jgi:catechol 2,3-dioxygenase-like lactoylglutathione lyase family enzyme